jgi:hypothetical protein
MRLRFHLFKKPKIKINKMSKTIKKTNRTLSSSRNFVYKTLTTCIRELVGERTKEWMENGETESEQLLQHYWLQVMDLKRELHKMDENADFVNPLLKGLNKPKK